MKWLSHNYQPESKDPTSGLERRINSVLWSLRQKNRLSDGTYRRHRSSAGGVPRLYSLPKINKPDVPLQPIVSFVSSTYALSKFLASFLSRCVSLTNHHVRNSGQFADFVDPNIQLTVENQKGGQLPFLDILVSRDSDGSISTSVYHKPTHTDQYLHFQTHHPLP